MDVHKNTICTDLDLLHRLPALAFLSAAEVRELANGLRSANYRKGEVIFSEAALTTGVHILLAGVAKITCLNRGGTRVTVALLAPGPIPEFLSSLGSRWHFRCEAYRDCRVEHLDWNQFDAITKATSQAALRTFHEDNLRRWYGWSLTFLGLDLHERLAFALRQLCSIFGVEESRGTLLLIAVSQRDLANLVGASRPRVTEHLAKLERERVLVRQGRQLIVRLDRIENLSVSPWPERRAFLTKAAAPAGFRKEARRQRRHSMAAEVSTN